MAWVNGVWEEEDPAFQLGGMGVYPRQAVSPGDVWQRMMATSPWGMNPLSRRAAEAARPIMESQYNIQQPGIMMPEGLTGANPYGAFMRGQLYGMQAPGQATTQEGTPIAMPSMAPGTSSTQRNLPGRLPGMLGGADLMNRLRRIASLTTPTAEGQMLRPENPLDIALQETYADPQMQLQAAMLPAMMQSAPAARGSLQRGFERLFNQFMEKDPSGNFLSQMVGERSPFAEGMYQGAPPWQPSGISQTTFGTSSAKSQTALISATGSDKVGPATEIILANNGDMGSKYVKTDDDRVSIDTGQHSQQTVDDLAKIAADLDAGRISSDAANKDKQRVLEAATSDNPEWSTFKGGMILTEDLLELQRLYAANDVAGMRAYEESIPIISQSEWASIQRSPQFTAQFQWREGPSGRYQSVIIPKKIIPKSLRAYQKGS